MKNTLFKPKNKEELTKSLCEAYDIPKELMKSYNKVDLFLLNGRRLLRNLSVSHSGTEK